MNFSLKVITCLQTSPWKFLKLQNGPYPLSSTPCSVLAAAHRRHRRRRRGEASGPPCFRRAGAHASPRSLLTALGLALVLPCSAMRSRRSQSRPRGRHLAAAVASSLQRPPPSPSMRTGTTRTPALYSTRPFACSAIPRPRTRRRSTRNAGEPSPAVDPPLQSSSARADTLASSAVTPRSSSTTSPRLTLTGEP